MANDASGWFNSSDLKFHKSQDTCVPPVPPRATPCHSVQSPALNMSHGRTHRGKSKCEPSLSPDAAAFAQHSLVDGLQVTSIHPCCKAEREQCEDMRSPSTPRTNCQLLANWMLQVELFGMTRKRHTERWKLIIPSRKNLTLMRAFFPAQGE